MQLCAQGVGEAHVAAATAGWSAGWRRARAWAHAVKWRNRGASSRTICACTPWTSRTSSACARVLARSSQGSKAPQPSPARRARRWTRLPRGAGGAPTRSTARPAAAHAHVQALATTHSRQTHRGELFGELSRLAGRELCGGIGQGALHRVDRHPACGHIARPIALDGGGVCAAGLA